MQARNVPLQPTAHETNKIWLIAGLGLGALHLVVPFSNPLEEKDSHTGNQQKADNCTKEAWQNACYFFAKRLKAIADIIRNSLKPV